MPALLDTSLLQEIKRLHFQTKRLADQGLCGSYRSAFRGRGVEFEEVREYVPGDDVRAINWRVTARSQGVFVKSYREERDLTVMLAVDISASTLTGTRTSLRDRLIAKIGAVLTFIALSNNDRVGLVTFSDCVHSYHPPRKARGAVWRILHEVMEQREHIKGTNIGEVCRFLRGVLKRTAIIFIISDFFDKDYESALGHLASRHDLTAIVVRDPCDTELGRVGLLRLRDPESGLIRELDTSDNALQHWYRQQAIAQHAALLTTFQRHGLGVMEVSTEKDFMPVVRRYLAERLSRKS